MSNNEKQIKIVVISALREELAYLLAKKEEFNWQNPKPLIGKYSYRLGTLKNKEGKTCQIAAVPQPLDEMGLIDAAILSSIAISKLKPEYIVLIGICGGIEGSVNIGDIIIPRQAFHYQSGKLQGTGKLKKGLIDEKADGTTINNIINFFEEYSPDEIVKKAIDLRVVKIGNEIKHLNIPPGSSIKVHFLNIASADLVNDHPDSIKSIESNHDRKAISLDMESLAVLKAAKELDTKAVVIKSVSDIPTEESRRETQENYRDFAKFAATEAFYKFATESKFFFDLDSSDIDIVSTKSSTFQTVVKSSKDYQQKEPGIISYSAKHLLNELKELEKDYAYKEQLLKGYRQQLRILTSEDVDRKLRLEHQIEETEKSLNQLDLQISLQKKKVDAIRK